MSFASSFPYRSSFGVVTGGIFSLTLAVGQFVAIAGPYVGHIEG